MSLSKVWFLGRVAPPSFERYKLRLVLVSRLIFALSVDYKHSDSGLTALMVCAAHGMKDHAEQLIAIGADSGVKGPDGVTAIDLACKHGHANIASLLMTQR